jgi:transcriptional regulator with XRE-family HTH domain
VDNSKLPAGYVAAVKTLRDERNRRGLSQAAVGFRIGRSSQAVCMWESFSRICPGDELYTWAAVLDCPLPPVPAVEAAA